MASEFFLKQGDRLPVLQSQLADANGYVDLTSASGVQFVFRPKPTGTATIGSASIISGAIGLVQYDWATADTTQYGVFQGEWRVTFTNGKKITFPNDSYITFEITEGIS